MAKIRHIAYRARTLTLWRSFSSKALGMTMTRNARITPSISPMGRSILRCSRCARACRNGEPTKQPGIDHIGFSADNDQEQFRLMEAAGAKKGRERLIWELRITKTNSSGPKDIIVDVGHWEGAAPVDKEGH